MPVPDSGPRFDALVVLPAGCLQVARLDCDGRGLMRLYYNEAMSRNDAVVFPVPGCDEDWPSGTFVSGPGCYAYLLDGAPFSMSIVFSVEREAA